MSETDVRPDRIIAYATHSHRTLLYHVSSVIETRTTPRGNTYATIRACRVVRRNGAYRLASRCDYKVQVMNVAHVSVIASGVTIDDLLSTP